MYYLCYHQKEADLQREIIPEIKLFFRRIQQIKQTLERPNHTPYLNRIQRERCKDNLYAFERLAREFDAIDNRDDFYLLHQRLQRYLRLHTPDLKNVLGQESAGRITLFMHCG